MEAANKCDADSLLPPRKRLLAGLKRQSSDVNRPPPSASHIVNPIYDSRLNSVLRAKLNDPNLSNDEIVEISRSAAAEAASAAEAARANAEVKALKAASAMAAAKSALDLVATISSREKQLRKNKMKKHVAVEALYSKNRSNKNSRGDEELARKLHQAINSSPRILKNTSCSESKNQKEKRLKSSSSGRASIQSAVPPADENKNGSSQATRDGMTTGDNSESPAKETDMIMDDLNATKTNDDSVPRLVEQEQHSTKTDQPKLETCPTESCDTSGKKRGRMKQKKLPLSICSFRDQTNQRDELKPQATQNPEDNTTKESSFPPQTTTKTLVTVEETSTWKCQAFKVPVAPCVTQNKVNL